jgi:hypothetical protein
VRTIVLLVHSDGDIGSALSYCQTASLELTTHQYFTSDYSEDIVKKFSNYTPTLKVFKLMKLS